MNPHGSQAMAEKYAHWIAVTPDLLAIARGLVLVDAGDNQLIRTLQAEARAVIAKAEPQP